MTWNRSQTRNGAADGFASSPPPTLNVILAYVAIVNADALLDSI